MKRARKKSDALAEKLAQSPLFKRLLSAALLAFVAVCLAALATKHLRAPSERVESALPDDGLVVAYLHGNARCADCENLERAAREAVEGAVAEGRLPRNVVFRSINYEREENKPLFLRYELVAPSIVLVRRADGKDAAWKNLAEAWDLRGDPPRLREYLLAEIGQFEEPR